MGFFSKLFGVKSKGSENNEVESLLRNTVDGILEKGHFTIQYELTAQKEDSGDFVYTINFYGEDEDLFKDKKGQILDSLQLLLKRVVQHNFSEDKSHISVDCGGYREDSAQALIERAENLKNICIDQGKAVYYRALPPKDRKIVHQYLAQDLRVKSRSLGDGLYKKIKIYPSKDLSEQDTSDDLQD